MMRLDVQECKGCNGIKLSPLIVAVGNSWISFGTVRNIQV